jgi:hypothetical protein
MSAKLNIKPSSNIEAAHYDSDNKELTVHFKNGSKYSYSRFSQEAASNFEKADSSGKHLNSCIVGKYPTRKI